MSPLPVITGHLATATSLHLYINATSLHQSYISTSLLQQCYCGPFSVFWGPVNILGPVLVIAGRHTDCKTATSLHLNISTSLLRQCYCSIVTTAVLLWYSADTTALILQKSSFISDARKVNREQWWNISCWYELSQFQIWGRRNRLPSGPRNAFLELLTWGGLTGLILCSRWQGWHWVAVSFLLTHRQFIQTSSLKSVCSVFPVSFVRSSAGP